MNNNKLAEVENFLSSASVFDFLETLDADSALDSRDEPEFDDPWMKEFNSLENEFFLRMILNISIPCEKKHLNYHSE
ncbi:hypothetical protein LDK53_22105 [Enterobacter sp. K16B]|uniref:hypothetical protein n=1 Tax=Enterobacter sp. K16B TaxID=2878537 RepID=UPI001CD9E710|nr:hypothetical protein [Enterobacter sp. K16B]MCA2028635.1 hypothetical protein [Enterobacter sp. K16B]